MKSIKELADVSAAKPSEVFSRLILEGAQESRKLSEIVAATAEDVNAGNGSVVKVTYFPSRVAQGPIAVGSGPSKIESTMKSFSITVKQYADFDALDGFSLFEAGDDVKVALLDAMGRGFGAKFDAEVYAKLAAATPVVSADCKADLTDLLDAIVDAKAELAKKGVEPTHVLIGPMQEAALLKQAVMGNPKGALIVVDAGKITQIAGVNVIVTANVPSTGAAGDIQAIVLDRSRAVGEAFGLRPSFEEERDPATNVYKEFAWAYYGASALDTEGIAKVVVATA